MKFVGVTPGDGVAVVARSVERAPEIEEAVEAAELAEGGTGPDTADGSGRTGVDGATSDATIGGEATGDPVTTDDASRGETEES